jgi:hypothetical protein
MSKRKCGRCGKDPAEGFASIWSIDTGEVYYCHGDDEETSCYEESSWDTSWAAVGAPQ